MKKSCSVHTMHNHSTLHYTTLHYNTVRYTTLYTTLLYTLHYTTLLYTLHYTTLLYTLHYTTLHYTTLNYTTLNYTTLHYTTLPLHYTTRERGNGLDRTSLCLPSFFLLLSLLSALFSLSLSAFVHTRRYSFLTQPSRRSV